MIQKKPRTYVEEVYEVVKIYRAKDFKYYQDGI